ncbi:hypothetical protein [Ornithinimicrobium kibberense]|uniref:hypothetical protein n=1 Tax=Ornithinimicrobium kibberense TaxID=282060 RepID=UPI00361DDB19
MSAVDRSTTSVTRSSPSRRSLSSSFSAAPLAGAPITTRICCPPVSPRGLVRRTLVHTDEKQEIYPPNAGGRRITRVRPRGPVSRTARRRVSGR